MSAQFPGGVWPVMLTPFTSDRAVDYAALPALVDFYESRGVNGLFSVCQSSEMFFLTLDERIKIAEIVAKSAKIPVIASGHVSDDFAAQADELTAMATTGVRALVLITNRIPGDTERDWVNNAEKLLARLPDIPLGLYECPHPFKRLMTAETLNWAAQTGRFHFLKDTCCDMGIIRERLRILKDTPLRLYNANSTTLLPSLIAGAAGFSGVMANFHPQLYVNLIRTRDERLAEFLSFASLIERQLYPVNAKFHLSAIENLPITTFCRTTEAPLTETMQAEIRAMHAISQLFV